MSKPSTGTVRERCAVCGCVLYRVAGVYALPSVEGRAHATMHHHVAERFFGRSKSRKGPDREPIFAHCPWEGAERAKTAFCYECHEELLHNPVLLPADVARFAGLVRSRGLHEELKPENRDKLAGRIELLHEVIVAGLAALADERQVVR